MNSLLGSLGLCRRAGKLVAGYEPVRDMIRKKEAQLVLCAGGASAKTRKEIEYFTKKYGIELAQLPLSMSEIEPLFHKRVAVMAITNADLACMVCNLLSKQEKMQ